MEEQKRKYLMGFSKTVLVALGQYINQYSLPDSAFIKLRKEQLVEAILKECTHFDLQQIKDIVFTITETSPS